MYTNNAFEIPFKLPSMNEYINACRTHWANGARMKKATQQMILQYLRAAMYKGRVRPIEGSCVVHFEWRESTMKRDCDNVASAKKYILDAMQEAGVFPNDNRRYVRGFTDTFVKAERDGVLITIEELPI